MGDLRRHLRKEKHTWEEASAAVLREVPSDRVCVCVRACPRAAPPFTFLLPGDFCKGLAASPFCPLALHSPGSPRGDSSVFSAGLPETVWPPFWTHPACTGPSPTWLPAALLQAPPGHPHLSCAPHAVFFLQLSPPNLLLISLPDQIARSRAEMLGIPLAPRTLMPRGASPENAY